MRCVEGNLKRFDSSAALPSDEQGALLVEDSGYGESAILVALTHPESMVVARMGDAERLEIAALAAKGFVNNIKFSL